jgi:hypothetical protein
LLNFWWRGARVNRCGCFKHCFHHITSGNQPSPTPSPTSPTVLDDNCTLCLPNGERIKLNPVTMRMLFEVGDLAAASPATVSRCGMVYVPPESLGWKPAVRWVDGGLSERAVRGLCCSRALTLDAHPEGRSGEVLVSVFTGDGWGVAHVLC